MSTFVTFTVLLSLLTIGTAQNGYNYNSPGSSKGSYSAGNGGSSFSGYQSNGVGSTGFSGSQSIGTGGISSTSQSLGNTGFSSSLGSSGMTVFSGSHGSNLESASVGLSSSLGSSEMTGFSGSQGSSSGSVGLSSSLGTTGFSDSQSIRAGGISSTSQSLGNTGFSSSLGSSGMTGFSGSQGSNLESASVGLSSSLGSLGTTGLSGSDGSSSGSIGLSSSLGTRGFSGSQSSGSLGSVDLSSSSRPTDFSSSSLGNMQNFGLNYRPGYTNQAPIINKYVYFHVAPEEPEQVAFKAPPSLPPPVKNYKIIFIKTPSPPAYPSPVIPVQPQNEEKTLVYVLVKKPDEQPDIVIPTASPTKPSKPEVYFIRYKTQKEQSAGNGGIVATGPLGSGINIREEIDSDSISIENPIAKGQNRIPAPKYGVPSF